MEDRIFTHIDDSTQPRAKGLLADTTVAIEPSICVKDWPTQAQSLALENYVALEDATLVQHLRNAGAHLKGRTAMAELGLGLENDTGAAAIANGLVDVVLKTDTTGEARMAAADSGCFGFKPSYGLISRSGMIGLVPSMETCGILANSLDMISKTVQTMAGIDQGDASMDEPGIEKAMYGFSHPKDKDRPITLGLIKGCRHEMDTTDDMETAIDRLARSGLGIKKVEIKDFSLAPVVHNLIGSVEASSSAGRFDSVRYGHRTSALTKNWNEMYIKSRKESFGPLVKAYLFQGGYFQYHNYNAFVDACRTRARLIQNLERAFKTVDLILLPVSKSFASLNRPDTLSDLYDTFSLTVLANLTGNPAISIPGFPALQLIGKRFDDPGLLALAARISDIHTKGNTP